MTNLETVRIKKALHDGAIHEVIDFLNVTEDKTIFKTFREQKILINELYFAKLTDSYRECAKRLLPDPLSFVEENNYLTFVSLYLSATLKLRMQIKNHFGNMLNRRLQEVLVLLFIQFERSLEQMEEQFDLKTNTAKKGNQSAAETAESWEWSLNTLKGMSNDNVFAMLRLITFFTEWQTENPANEFVGLTAPDEVANFYDAIRLAGQINSYDFAMAKVSYGEWSVKKIDHLSKMKISFEIIDESLELARDIALKRKVASAVMGRRYPFPLQNCMEEVVDQAVDFAFDYYEEVAKTLPKQLKAEVKKTTKRMLDGIGLEDQLLAELAGSTVVFSQYIVATTLLSFARVGFALRASHPYRFYFVCAELPVEAIVEFIGQVKIDGALCQGDLTPFICGPTLKNQFEVHGAPFLRDRYGLVFAIDYLSGADPQLWVRKQFMKGGSTAAKVGLLWEDYLTKMLTMDFNCVVKNGVGIKRDGKLVTDIDLLAIRNDLLLIIQVKSYYGDGLNHFEQWKFRQKVMHGARQALKAAQAIDENKNLLNRFFSVGEVDNIKHIQSLVLTNAEIFNNWNYLGVPVMSVIAMNQVINGATVTYKTGKKKVKGSVSFINGLKISSLEFMEFLRNPLDWKLSLENLKKTSHEETFEDCILNFPIFENQTGFQRSSL